MYKSPKLPSAFRRGNLQVCIFTFCTCEQNLLGIVQFTPTMGCGFPIFFRPMGLLVSCVKTEIQSNIGYRCHWLYKWNVNFNRGRVELCCTYIQKCWKRSVYYVCVYGEMVHGPSSLGIWLLPKSSHLIISFNWYPLELIRRTAADRQRTTSN